ncbi:hypothetical protein HDV03_005279 [Kappamyces sp. JEL0829]|nr:hypothetical protein HDV03_005279 [Kappamyces sp. JEL0829]
MSMKYGMTFGNATREILKTDPSLKKGMIQQEFAKKVQKQKALANVDDLAVPDEHKRIWERQNAYATGDDRFSFPPVPGYTGYVPRSRDHFGRPFVETTNASLLEFKRMLKSKNTLPPKVLSIQQARQKREEQAVLEPSRDTQPPVHITSFDPYASSYQNESSPYKLPANHPQKTFISGYTGFVPRLQNHFGEPYSHSVRRAIDDFVQPPPPANPYVKKNAHPVETARVVTTKPIPGFTGFIPGSRTCYSMSFGKTAESAYDQFNNRDENGRTPSALPTMPAKDLKKFKPIAGYRGFKSHH